MLLDHHRARLSLHTAGRRPFLLAVTATLLALIVAFEYAGVGGAIGLDRLVLVAAAALGLLIPPQRLVAAMAPAWLLAPISGQVFAIAHAATCALAVSLVLRFVGGALPARRTTVWFALFAAALTVSLLHPAVATPAALSPWHDLVGVLTGLAVAASATSAPPDLSLVAKTIAIAGAVVAGVILIDGALAAGRLVGAGLNPNYLGGMLAPPCIAAIGLAWHVRQPAWLFVAAPGAVALVQTQSRGALVAAVAGAGYLVLRERSWWQRALVVAATALLPVLFGNVLIKLLIGGRSATELDANNAIRGEALRLALEIAVQHPLRGIGYGAFPAYAAAAPQIGIFVNTHNEYARLACEAGVPAAALFVVLLVLAMRGRRGDSAAILRAIVVVYAVGLLFGNFMSSMFVSVPFWLALGCLLAGGEKPHGAPSRGRVPRPQTEGML